MARKKQSQGIPLPILKLLGVICLAGLIGLGIFKGIEYFSLNSAYFKVRGIVVDPALGFINPEYLSGFKGRNIFAINLKDVEDRLGQRYPQVDQLKVVRRFPDQLLVLAKQRRPVAQIELNKNVLTLDNAGVIISMTTRRDESLSLIKNADTKQLKNELGRTLFGNDIRVALLLIDTFRENRILDSLRITGIDVANLSKIEFDMSNGLKVFVDQDNIDLKMKVLGIVLTKGNLDYEQINYLDLRFKEPIIGKK